MPTCFKNKVMLVWRWKCSENHEKIWLATDVLNAFLLQFCKLNAMKKDSASVPI